MAELAIGGGARAPVAAALPARPLRARRREGDVDLGDELLLAESAEAGARALELRDPVHEVGRGLRAREEASVVEGRDRIVDRVLRARGGRARGLVVGLRALDRGRLSSLEE